MAVFVGWQCGFGERPKIMPNFQGFHKVEALKSQDQRRARPHTAWLVRDSLPQKFQNFRVLRKNIPARYRQHADLDWWN